MFHRSVEIIAAVEMLQDLPLYIRRFPFGKAHISKLRYLRHHVEFYFHQVYVLEQRLTTYLRFVEKSYNKPETQYISQSAGPNRANTSLTPVRSEADRVAGCAVILSALSSAR
jgi:hypothetical protein